MDIYLSKKIINDLKLSNDIIGAYIALRKIQYSMDKTKYYVTINMLLYEMFGNCNYNRSDYKHISDGLTGLIENKLVIVVDKVSNSEYIVDLSALVIDRKKNKDDSFTIITEE